MPGVMAAPSAVVAAGAVSEAFAILPVLTREFAEYRPSATASP